MEDVLFRQVQRKPKAPVECGLQRRGAGTFGEFKCCIDRGALRVQIEHDRGEGRG